MPLANLALTNTFDEWRIRTNQLVTEVNDINANSNLIVNSDEIRSFPVIEYSINIFFWTSFKVE